LSNEALSKGGNKVDYHDYYKYRLSYITEKDLNLIFLFVTGLTDSFDSIKKELVKCKKEFLNLFEDILRHKYDSKTFEVFDPTIDSIHRNLRPKISLVGFSGVGKTTITKLIKAEEIPMQHVPTITGDIATIKIGKLYFHLWDFAGQEQFSYLWNNFIKGSDAVLLITDSSLENIEKSKFFLELIKEQAGQAHVAVIGNKQDLKDSLKPEQIETILGLKTYSMIAKEAKNRDKMIQIIADILEMSAEISPLLKPLLERDTFIEEAMKSLENAEFENAAVLFEKISYLCIELGDDSLGREFYEKAQKIKNLLQKSTQPPPAPIEETTSPSAPIEKTPSPSAPIEKTPSPPVPIEKTSSPPVAIKEAPAMIIKNSSPARVIENTPSQVIKATTTPKFARVEQVMEEEEKIQEVPTKTEVTSPLPTPPPLSIIDTKEKPQVETKPIPQEVKPNLIKKPTLPPKPPHLKVKTPPNLIEKKPEAIVKEEEPIIKPIIDLSESGLNLNPDDFMIKQRPKTITAVPKDARNKLKTSPFAQVENTSKNFTPKPVSPIKLVEPNLKSSPNIETPPKPPSNEFAPNIPIKKVDTPIPIDPVQFTTPKSKIITPPKSPPSVKEENAEIKEPLDTPIKKEQITTQQKSNIEKSLLDLKIKKSNISKIALDFDMKELTGEITSDELEEKKKKLDIIRQQLSTQIKELEDLMK